MKKILVFLLLFYSVESFSQGINNLWLMGYQSWAGQPYGGTDIDFIGGTPIINYHIRDMNFEEANSVICDSNGNLLFYTNGIYVANSRNDTMLNGVGLSPCIYTTMYDSSGLHLPQGCIVIPFPEDSTKYYLLHQSMDDYGNSYCSFYLYYSIIDMSLDSGLGALTLKNQVLINDSLIAGRLVACKHANGRDWWLIAHRNQTNQYCKYLITPYGITGPFMQSIGQARESFLGQCVFSPDGKKFACYEPHQDLDIMDFDRCSGDFSNLVHITFNDGAAAGGVAFSSNSNVLYASSTTYIYQFDVTSSNIPSTQTTVATYDGFYSVYPILQTTFYLCQLGPDGKIYINTGNATDYLHVINFPDSIGLACDVCQHCIQLPSYNAFTIPNHPNYFLEAEGGTVCDSLGLPNFINTAKEENNFSLFPNPFSSHLTLHFPSPQNRTAHLKIFNSIGEVVVEKEIKSQDQTLNLVALPQGIYLLSVLSEGKVYNQKIVRSP